MLNKILRMELLSDLCPASGDGFAGYVDTDVCFDGLGLPYIPAKRVKGVLRECGLDIISVDGGLSETFDSLFGKTGEFVPGSLNIGNGKLQGYTDIVSNLGDAQMSEIAEIYTSVRSRTKMEGGKAAAGSLRTARVLNRGQIYEFPVTFAEDDSELFGMCVKSLRNMGLNRSRGLGEIKCSLVENDRAGGVTFDVSGVEYPASGIALPGENTHCVSMSYTLELLEPVISASRAGLPGESEDYIFGSAVLGAFAVKYIGHYGLLREEAYKDTVFREIFLGGKVVFTSAFPTFPNKGHEVYYPAPAALKTDKQAGRLSDESAGIPEETDESEPICKRLGGYVSIDEQGRVSRVTSNKTTFPHHARPADKAKGRATEDDGNFFSYEALSEGQAFAGSIIGSPDHILKLKALFSDDDILRIGRSRTAQYGKVRISRNNSAFTPNNLTLRKGDVFRLVAVTPIILENANGINTCDINAIREVLGEDFEIARIIAGETAIAGYYGKWLLPRRQERAIAEGSTVVFRYNGGETTLNINFIGRRTGEGFGQIRIEPVPRADAFRFAPTDEIPSESTGALPGINELRNDKDAVAAGIIYGKNCYKTAPNNANLGRVLSALSIAGNYGEFAGHLADIKQPVQKVSALAFATGKSIRYFEAEHARSEENHIAELLENREYGIDDLSEKRTYDYRTYKKYLNAAGQRVKQKRRSGGEKQKGGGSNV